MRSFGHILFWVYRLLSILVIIVGIVQLILFKNNPSFSLNFLIPLIIIDLFLLCATTLVSAIRREGWQSIPQALVYLDPGAGTTDLQQYCIRNSQE